MDVDFLTFLAIGFLAQLIDGALGMAFGVISTTTLLSLGLSPAHASAAVHTAEVFTTGASAVSHAIHRNIERALVIRLAVAGSLGAFVGAHVLSNIDGRVVRPFIAAYLLLLGLSILLKSFRTQPKTDVPPRYTAPLGLVGGFLDAIGGGGWGPMVTSTLLGAGQAPRVVIGSVNTAEFFVTVTAATTFFIELGLAPIQALLGLTIGGVVAAPLGAYLARYVSERPLMIAVGILVIGLAGFQIAKSLSLL